MNEQIRLANVAAECYHMAEEYELGLSVTSTGISVISGARIISTSLRSLDQLYGWLTCYKEFVKKK